MTKDEKLKEAMELVRDIANQARLNGTCNILSFEEELQIAAIESKLRELIQ